MSSATLSILKLDAKGVTRDNVMLMNIVLSALVAIGITVVGIFKSGTNWADWFPFMVILSLMTGPPAYGFLFGLLMVDERDTGVRSVLSVTPVPATRLLMIRMITAVLLMIAWPLFTFYLMNSTWQAIEIAPQHIIALVLMLSLGAPLTALAVATYSQNKVEAMALFKGINFLVLGAMALYFIPGDAAYRTLFLILPWAWGVMAWDALIAGDIGAAYRWMAGGSLYLSLLLVWIVRTFITSIYKTDA
ncbi:MAG: hypothetical protein AAF311_01540 [Pseudomonadota bacterium]